MVPETRCPAQGPAARGQMFARRPPEGDPLPFGRHGGALHARGTSARRPWVQGADRWRGVPAKRPRIGPMAVQGAPVSRCVHAADGWQDPAGYGPRGGHSPERRARRRRIPLEGSGAKQARAAPPPSAPRLGSALLGSRVCTGRTLRRDRRRTVHGLHRNAPNAAVPACSRVPGAPDRESFIAGCRSCTPGGAAGPRRSALEPADQPWSRPISPGAGRSSPPRPSGSFPRRRG